MADSRCRVEMISGMRVVVAPAAIDVTTTDELRRILLDSVADGHATVAVDMTRTRSCSSAGFSVLVGAHRRARSRRYPQAAACGWLFPPMVPWSAPWI